MCVEREVRGRVTRRSLHVHAIRRDAAAGGRAVIARGVAAVLLGAVAERLRVEVDAFAAVGAEIEAALVAGAKRVRGRFAECVHAITHLGQQVTFDVFGPGRAGIPARVRAAATLLTIRARDAARAAQGEAQPEAERDRRKRLFPHARTLARFVQSASLFGARGCWLLPPERDRLPRARAALC